MSTFEGYCEYIGYDVQYIEGYYDACRGNHEYIGDVQYIWGIP